MLGLIIFSRLGVKRLKGAKEGDEELNLGSDVARVRGGAGAGARGEEERRRKGSPREEEKGMEWANGNRPASCDGRQLASSMDKAQNSAPPAHRPRSFDA
jgi:hypothetical protein